MLVRKVLAGVAGSMLMAGAAFADATPPLTAAPMASPSLSFSWSGPYVGADVAAYLGAALQVGLHDGYNFTSGRILYGVETELAVRRNGPFVIGHVGINARFGWLVGAKVLLYSEAGVNLWFGGGTPTPAYSFGKGVEIAVGANLSMFVEAKGVGVVGALPSLVQILGGINWHPHY